MILKPKAKRSLRLPVDRRLEVRAFLEAARRGKPTPPRVEAELAAALIEGLRRGNVPRT
jgi:hypothetical protein